MSDTAQQNVGSGVHAVASALANAVKVMQDNQAAYFGPSGYNDAQSQALVAKYIADLQAMSNDWARLDADYASLNKL